MNERLLGRSVIWIEATIFVGMAIHTPLTVWLGTFLPHGQVIKSWKELLMGLCLLLVIILVTKRGAWASLWSDWVVRIVAGYGALHLLMLPWHYAGVHAAAAGILIDLRYIVFFILVYVTVRLLSTARRTLIISVGIGAAIIIGFAILQLTVLPRDILAHIGYSTATVTPYLTVDLNHDYIRINSTLRGPNPLGAYAVLVLGLVGAYVVQRRARLTRPHSIVALLLVAGSLAAVWASYSRSAVIAAVITIILAATAASVKRIPRGVWISAAVLIFAAVGGIVAARDTAFVSNVVLHENPAGGSAEKSNEGHVNSLKTGVSRFATQPLGGGIGSTGSASLRGNAPLIIENQYLFIAHEVGWLGIGIFVALFGVVMRRLWQRRTDWLALGTMASGVGLAFIGLLLPVWVDDTVSIIWWGLAGVAIGAITVTRKHNGKKRPNHKKTA